MNKKILLTLLAILASCVFMLDTKAQERKAILYFFYGRDCPHCKNIEPYINKLPSLYEGVVLEKHEVWYNKTSRNLFIKMAAERGKKAEGVPTVIIGKDMYMGTDMTRIKELINKNHQKK